MRRLNIALVGEDSAGIQALRALADAGHRIVAVLASPSRRAPGAMTLWETAEHLGYATWPARLVKDPSLAERLSAAEVDLLLNVHSLFVISRDVLTAPRVGSFNMHPGPLPRYAGLNSVCWAIYRGERSHGVTLHEMVPEIDAGPIAYQASFALDEHETGLSLTVKCVRAGIELMRRLVETAATDPGAIPRLAQDASRREYFGAEVPQGGGVVWSRASRDVVNFVRACDFAPFPSPWGHPRARLGDQTISLVKAVGLGEATRVPPGTIDRGGDAGVRVATGDEWILVSRIMAAGRYLHPATILRAGERLEDGR
jgi:methionyl-tRNA formyltransferase